MLSDEISGWYFDHDGQAISQREWGRLRERDDYRRVDETHIDDIIWVSTVWIGIDVGIHSPDDPPMIFETMAFLGDGDDVVDPLDHWTTKYPTLGSAREGHHAVVASLRGSADSSGGK